jgi:signal transduction histidine kinase
MGTIEALSSIGRTPDSRRFLLIPLIAGLVCLLAASAVAFFWLDYASQQRIIDRLIRASERMFAHQLDEHFELLEILIEHLDHDGELSRAYRSGDREALYQAALPIFRDLSPRHRITHFYFTGVDRVSFLRVHDPRRHGDVIDRFSLREAVRTGQPATGIELGPLGTLALRLVAPWRMDGEIIGYIELGQEIGDAIGGLTEALPTEVAIAIRKDLLDREQWRTGMSRLGRNVDWDLAEDHVLVNMNANRFPPEALGRLLRRDGSAAAAAQTLTAPDGSATRFLLTPLLDASGRDIGRIVFFMDVTPFRAAFWRSVVAIIAIFGLVGGILALTLRMVVRRFERSLSRADRERDEAYAQLESRVEERTRDLSTEVARRERTEADLRAARDQAEFANRSKSEFLANMSHELRTPLNAIIGFAQVLRDEMFGALGNTRYRDYAADINDSGQHLLGLINDILDLSKIESGKAELHEDDIEVAPLLRSALNMVHERATSGGVTLETEIPDALPALHADERKLKQILVTLLSNAVKFTRPGGVVTLRTWYNAKSGYLFQVQDTGIGMAQEDIPKALSPFGQVDSALNRQYEGTGLGLPLSKTLTELHGGTLDLQSEPGVGTTVTLRLPAARLCPAPFDRLSATAEPARAS